MSARTTYTVLEESARFWPDVPALQQPAGKGKYDTYTFAEFAAAAREIACALHQNGVVKGENVALYTETRAEFYLADLGIMACGGVSAALYTSYPLPDQIRNLEAAGINVIFVEDAKSLRALRAATGDRLTHLRWILLTGEAGDTGALTLRELREAGRAAMALDPGLFERLRAGVRAEDPAILYLTSGATGEPKMGLTSHAAVVANADMGPESLGFQPGENTIVFLPSAHIAQRVVLEFVTLRMGVTVWFSESLSRLPAELRAVRPEFFLAPPRVWERMYASIGTEVRKKNQLSQRLFYSAVGLGLYVGRLQMAGKPVPGHLRAPWKLAQRLVFSKIRERLGGRLRVAASGAAPLGKDLASFFAAVGMPLVEGYGLTEGGVVTLNPLDRPKSGSIGKALPGVELRLAEDGELLVKSPALFSGYYRDPEATASVLRDGWLYTGDIAEIDDEGYVYITGRKKELIVSSNGKKIYPARIETLFKTEPVINQVLLIGDRLPYVTALFTLNAAHPDELRSMARSPQVFEQVKSAVSRVNKQLPGFEQIRKFKILERDFTIEQGEMTPTMKIRRNRVLENFRPEVNEMYAGKEESQ